MDSTLRVILWIIGIVIYFIIQANRNKNKNKPATPTATQPQKSQGEVKTFEDLLKELQQGGQSSQANQKNQQELERIKQAQQKQKVNTGSFADEGLKDAEERMKKALMEKEQTIREINERRKRAETEATKSYDDNVEEYVKKYESTPVYYNEANTVDYENPATANYKGLDNSGKDRFDPFDEKKNAEHPLMKIFRNKESLRDAFIVSEIFEKKS
jgi:membrane protein involved in colicin uptake